MPQIPMSRQTLHTRGGVLDHVLDNVFDMALLLDGQGNILFLSKGNRRVLPNCGRLIGQPVTRLDRFSPFAQVLSSGKSVENLPLELMGHRGFTNIYPLVDHGTVIGTLSYVYFQNRSAMEEIEARFPRDRWTLDNGEYHQVSLVDRSYTFSDFIGESPLVKEMLDRCRQAAACDYPVLLIGETGTGKEIIASGIHAARHPDRFAPYVAINCTAIPENLLESELFGHEKGSFTGADQRKVGKFEQAAEGDVLLDEIGDMSLLLQGKILRALESREFERVGGGKLIPFRAGVIAATNKHLPALIEEGQFRADLYYRLSVIEVFLIPLRKRPEDIPLLIEHFSRDKTDALRFTRQAMDYLKRYPWPGNVRQLKNLVYRLSALCGGQPITGDRVLTELSAGQENYNRALGPGGTLPAAGAASLSGPVPVRSLEELEREAIAAALAASGHNVTLAAKQLGIGRATLYKKLERHQL